MKTKLWPEDAPFSKGNGEEDIPGITPYIIESDHPTPAVVVYPGGGYQYRAEHEGEPIAKWLNSIGISAFVLSYRVAPYQHPAPMLDAKRAIRFLRYNFEKWNIDKTRLGILGFSAGGHLASTIGTHFDKGNYQSEDPIERESSRPDLMILCYPVITFDTSFTHIGSMTNLLGSQPTEEQKDYLSNEKQVTEDTPPSFIWHTADDGAVSAVNSMLFATALNRNNVPYELHIFESGNHGLGLALDEKEVKTWTNLCELWLRKQGF